MHMKCPNCGKGINPRSKACKHCKTTLIRKSDKIARKMTVSPSLVMSSGAALLCLALILLLNGTHFFAGLTAVVGLVFLFIGKTAR